MNSAVLVYFNERLQKGSGVGSRIFEVSVSVREPDSKDLCEAEEEPDAAHKPQHIPGVALQDV